MPSGRLDAQDTPLQRPAGIIHRRWELPALFAVLARRIGHESRRPESSLEARAHRHRQPSVASKNPGTRLVHLAEPARYLRLRPWGRIIMIPLLKEEGWPVEMVNSTVAAVYDRRYFV